MPIENPMQRELTEFVHQYGFSGVLEVLSHVAELKEQETEDKALKKRYHKAMLHLWWLHAKKFMQGL